MDLALALKVERKIRVLRAASYAYLAIAAIGVGAALAVQGLAGVALAFLSGMVLHAALSELHRLRRLEEDARAALRRVAAQDL